MEAVLIYTFGKTWEGVADRLGLFSRFGLGTDEKEEPLCGGIVDRTDPTAPKEIICKDIVQLKTNYFLFIPASAQGERYFEFEVKADESGTLFAEEKQSALSIPASETFLHEVQSVIEKHELVKQNGVWRVTSGLPPQYQECPLRVQYASGERLFFATDNDPCGPWQTDLYLAFARHFAVNGIRDYPVFSPEERGIH